MPLKATHYAGIIFSFVLLLVLANFLILFKASGNSYSYTVGDVSRETIRSPRSVIFSSESKTNELAESAAQEIDAIYKLDQSAYSRQEEIIVQTFSQIRSILQSDESVPIKREKLVSISSTFSDDELYDRFVLFSNEDIVVIEQVVLSTLLDLHKTELISEDSIEEIKKSIPSKISSNLPADQIEIATKVAQNLLVQNTIIDQVETAARKDQIRDTVEPVFYQVKQDEVILARGEVVDSVALEKLEAVGLLAPGFIRNEQIGTVLLVSILALLLFIFILRSEKSIKRITSVISIVFFGTIALILLSQYFLEAKPVLVYVVPIAAAAISAGLVSNQRIGIFTGLFFTALTSFTFGNLFDVLVIHGVLSIVGLLLFRHIERFRSVAKPVALLTFIHYALVISFHFLSGAVTFFKASQLLLVSVAFSLSTVVIVIGLLILMSLIFRVSTFPILLDLANPTSPLLRELSVKAPGTYHHSLIVGSLAERAVRDIGGNVLLAKVASYYHDIGKLNNPAFYIENRKRIPTDKDVVDPLKEAKKVLSHVDYGETLALKHRLPQELVDAIRQHHGTTIVLYFYNLSDKKSQEDFRYKGPKPQTRESAVIMLADSVEAFVRSYSEQKDFNLEQAIKKIVNDRLADGQLDDSGLTLQELKQIQKSFVEILQSVYHERIAYE